VGTVAEETARLVEALGDWARSATAGEAAQPEEAAPDQAGTRHTPGCERCGGTSPAAGEAIACQLCPVCQGIALLRAVRPETVERLADLAGALSGVLRDIAAERAERAGRAGQGAPARPDPPPRRGQRVQDINVDDEDGHRPRTARADNEQTTPSTQESAAP
jgi:hypothetical protein